MNFRPGLSASEVPLVTVAYVTRLLILMTPTAPLFRLAEDVNATSA